MESQALVRRIYEPFINIYSSTNAPFAVGGVAQGATGAVSGVAGGAGNALGEATGGANKIGKQAPAKQGGGALAPVEGAVGGVGNLG